MSALEDGEEVIECESRRATPEECFYLQWADQAPERHLRLLTDLLGRTVALAVALAGATAVFIDPKALPASVRLVAACFFLAALVASCIAIYPKLEHTAYNPDAIRAFMEKAAWRKGLGLTVAAVCILMGILLLAVAAFARLFVPPA